jgi:hypothetical protein
MPYTLWSDGVLLGETDLAVQSPLPDVRLGSFRPTAAGDALLPTMLQVLTAMHAIGSMLERERLTRERLGDDFGLAVLTAMQTSPEGKNLRAAQDAVDALHLELKDDAGAVVPNVHISLNDLANFGADPVDLTPARLAEEGASAFGRYMLTVVEKKD